MPPAGKPPTPVVDLADQGTRGRLISAALELLDEGGIEEVSLRKIAQRAGVSHGAPLRHFASYAELLSHVAARGLDMLVTEAERADDALAPGAGARARLVAVVHAYVDVALGHPALFSLIFRPELVDIHAPVYQQASARSFANLKRHVCALQDTGWHVDIDTTGLSLAVWSQAHGLAALWPQIAQMAALSSDDLRKQVDLSLSLALGQVPDEPPASRRRNRARSA